MRTVCYPTSLPQEEQTLFSIILDVELGIQSWYFATCSKELGHQELIIGIQ
jgi:hypothetical protein